MAWEGSDRASRLPGDWSSRVVPAVMLRDGRQCRIRGPRCTRRATEVDHVVPGDDHRLGNLQAACNTCHLEKTIAERPRPESIYRKPERHPGLL